MLFASYLPRQCVKYWTITWWLKFKRFITISPLQVRTINDQLMYLERAFIDPLGLPGRPFYRLFTHIHGSKSNQALLYFAVHTGRMRECAPPQHTHTHRQKHPSLFLLEKLQYHRFFQQQINVTKTFWLYLLKLNGTL